MLGIHTMAAALTYLQIAEDLEQEFFVPENEAQHFLLLLVLQVKNNLQFKIKLRRERSS